jgi:DNA-binding CsgD family transcriptional regulator
MSVPREEWHALVGRDAERARIGALLEAAHESRSGALVIRGEPGIGKTALLEDARQEAVGMEVLSARGVESESELPFAALDQLLRPALGHVDGLPPPQATALRRALGLEEGPTEERFLVAAACLSLLSELSEAKPVLCLVDDAHWLDAASAEALLFVSRRLGAEGIAMLFAAREGDVREFAADHVPSLTLTGLDREASTTLLEQVAGRTAPSVQERLFMQTRGNALGLVELSAALNAGQLAGDKSFPETFPLTRRIESIFLERVRRMPTDTQQALVVAAADESEDLNLVTRATLRLGLGEHALALAEQEGLVGVHGLRLEFRHPLIRSAVYAAATFIERTEAHRVLAEVLDDDDMRADRWAWHLAASVLEHDAAAVRALEQAGERAEERAAPAAAAKAFARAAELSDTAADKGRYLTRAARAASTAGADDLAVSLATEADRLIDDPVLRAEIARAFGAADVRRGRPSNSLPRLLAAVDDVAPLDIRKAVELLVWATAAGHTGGQFAAADIASAADRVLALGGNDELMPLVQALRATARTMEGKTIAGGELDAAFHWALASDAAEHVFPVAVAIAVTGDDRHFAPLLDRSVTLARVRGEFGILAEALVLGATRHVMQQRLEPALREATESLEFARDLGAANVRATGLSILALVAAFRGERHAAAQYADEVLELATTNDLAPRAAVARYALAVLDLGYARWTDALARLRVVCAADQGDALLAKWSLPDLVEAAVRAGDRDEAREAFEAYASWARSGPPWTATRVAACRALLAEGEQASAHYEEALAQGPGLRPFDYARVQLLYGEQLRRLRRRTDSRVQLRAAHSAFEAFRAEPWAERARSELRASGESARRRDPSTIDQLTPQELQIARFVADGMTNKEVAAQLYLSPRTIDYHLRQVFSKLGITSRTQLARLALSDESSHEALSTA